ncbi:MAG: hypothetical protein RML45_00885 [Acetobacteraceae bacterium]|nr:hypothetical protein [Acetobacteraceae bacterium]
MSITFAGSPVPVNSKAAATSGLAETTATGALSTDTTPSSVARSR